MVMLNHQMHLFGLAYGPCGTCDQGLENVKRATNFIGARVQSPVVTRVRAHAIFRQNKITLPRYFFSFRLSYLSDHTFFQLLLVSVANFTHINRLYSLYQSKKPQILVHSEVVTQLKPEKMSDESIELLLTKLNKKYKTHFTNLIKFCNNSKKLSTIVHNCKRDS